MKKLIIVFTILILNISCNNNTIVKNIVINLGNEPRTIDPSLNDSNPNAAYILSCFEGLTKKDKDNNIIPGAAEKWDISEDGLTYIFYLRTNAKWSDGKPVTAHDFVYSWRRVVDPKAAAQYSIFLEPIKNAKEITMGEKDIKELGVKAINDYTLKVTVNYPVPYFLDFTGYFTLCPVREDIIEKYGDNWTLNPETYIGNGAFKMIERKTDEKIVMIKNTNYWDTDNIKPEKLTFIMLNDNTAALASIKDGSIHLSKSVYRNTAKELIKEDLISISQLLATYYIEIDMNNEVLKDIRIREALSLAIDRNYIVSNVTLMNENVTYFLIPNNIKNYKIDRTNSYIHNDYAKNVKKAKQLLAEAGYPDGKKFPILDFTIVIRDFEVELCEAIQSMWKENLGIDVRINKYDHSTFLQFFVNKNISGLLSSRNWIDYNDPISFLNIFKSDSTLHMFYSNTYFDDIINQAQKYNDITNRTKLLYKAEKLLVNDEIGIIPLFNINDVILISQNLKDVEYDPMNG